MGMLGGGRAIQPNVHFQMLRMNYDCGGVKKGLFGECYLDEADREVCVSRSRKLILVTGSFCCLAFERLVLHILVHCTAYFGALQRVLWCCTILVHCRVYFGAWEAGAVGEMVH